jgi:hypothetical protein
MASFWSNDWAGRAFFLRIAPFRSVTDEPFVTGRAAG